MIGTQMVKLDYGKSTVDEVEHYIEMQMEMESTATTTMTKTPIKKLSMIRRRSIHQRRMMKRETTTTIHGNQLIQFCV